MDKKEERIELKDSERQPCEVWTRVMGYHRFLPSIPVKRVNFTNASAL